MSPHLETATAAAKIGWAFGTAGLSAFGALTSRFLGATIDLPLGLERVLDLGFAGVFIAALIYGIRIVWVSKLESDKKHDELERQVREGLMKDLQEANRARGEMIELMRRKENRDTTP